MTDINSANAEYTENKPNWQLVRDLIKGESALKSHDLAIAKKTAAQQTINQFKLNERYLPMPGSYTSTARLTD